MITNSDSQARSMDKKGNIIKSLASYTTQNENQNRIGILHSNRMSKTRPHIEKTLDGETKMLEHHTFPVHHIQEANLVIKKHAATVNDLQDGRGDVVD